MDTKTINLIKDITNQSAKLWKETLKTKLNNIIDSFTIKSLSNEEKGYIALHGFLVIDKNCEDATFIIGYPEVQKYLDYRGIIELRVK